MPKSKRAKLSERLFTAVREAADTYSHIFVFSVENMRNTYLKDVRTEFADSRIFFGKTKVMAKALGTDASSEHLPNLAKLSEHLAGNVGLLFTNREPQEILEHFAAYAQTDYARAGTVADRTFTIPAGVVHSRGGELAEEDDVPLPHSLEVTVRKWGMPTKLVKGKVVLDTEYTVCKEGETLNSNQTALLKMFGVAMAEFRVQMKAYYSAATQEVKVVDVMEE
ncbi:mRNA turnover and ribosome assembly protein [Coniosporium tulheliwenetii]|uniref:mRNA turnover and ribosome assembly protein n=1 Tax=Coniosporium tulheliwenetii TaxID=3383036 RepID=A0ACC2YR82_9PEZI|nr:mRNA turnover and ribosome assembly protein [Cladosporium sp. JES 115]